MNIYSVRTANFSDILYYATWEEAQDFAKDQRAMGFWASVEGLRISAKGFRRLMATMKLPDGQGVRA